MAKYLFQADYTPEGIAGLQREGGTKRREVFEGMFSEMGGAVESFYYAFGADDLYMIVDLPADASAVAAPMAASAAGAISFKATVLVTPETVDEAVRRTVNYRPPGK